MNVIEIKNLTKLYGNGRGIKNLNLTVEQGDILGLLGPNGSGKTTAMKAILNLVNAEGSVKVFGMDLHDNFESIMQRTGALIESPAIYKDLSAYQNVKMHANMYPNIDRKRIEHILDVVHLLPYKNDKAGKFSLGMKQRLGIAQALLNQPKILVIDEPTAGLDPKERVRFRDLIKDLGKDSIVLLSTHIVSDIEHIADDILMMKSGQLIYQGKWTDKSGNLEEFYLKQFEEIE